MTDNANSQLVVRAKFNFQQTNEDELSFSKGDVIHVTRVEEGGWWEGTHNGRTGWFPSNYVREIKPSGEWLNLTVREAKDVNVLECLFSIKCRESIWSSMVSSVLFLRMLDKAPIIINWLCIRSWHFPDFFQRKTS